jgi:hypothetical protein
MASDRNAASRLPEKLGDRVVMKDGTKGVIVASHPKLKGVVLVQPDAPDMAWYTREELTLDDDA